MTAVTPIIQTDPDWTKIDTQIKHAGKEIVLPAEPGNMDYDDAITTLERVKEQENQKFDVNEVVVGGPWDALVAVYSAMQEIYGVVLAQSSQTWFGEVKPDFVTVDTGPGPTDKVQVPMGQMSLPGVSEPVQIGLVQSGAYIMGTVRRRDRARLIEIANKARDLLRKKSVYRGKSIRLGVDDDGDLNMRRQPEFLDLSKVKVTDMIHTAETEAQIKTNIFSPLQHTEACRKHGIPLKRGILFEGRYGTGKSLTARITAKVGNDNGWTFIILDRAQGLRAAIEFAQTYQPCIIFAEDIDRAADREDESVNDLVNLIDGVIRKDMEIMVVLTTNFIEKIDRALLRPGRFDAVISIQAPDAKTAERLIELYARGLLAPTADISKVGAVVAGQIPATIREVVERAKLSMLGEDRTTLTTDDLMTSAIGMKRHMELLNPPADEPTAQERFYGAFKELIADAVGQVDEADFEAINDGLERVVDISRVTHSGMRALSVGVAQATGAAATAADRTEKLHNSLREAQVVAK
jgi:transitional endoplasmic reticulum ATPase